LCLTGGGENNFSSYALLYLFITFGWVILNSFLPDIGSV
jgi:hypothetical protein